MPGAVTLFHNPRCGTSRRALELLREAGHEPEIVEYLKTGWTRERLATLLKALDAKPRDILRRKELGAAALDGAGDDAILAAMVAHPVLVERPIALRGGEARLGRPAERVLDLI